MSYMKELKPIECLHCKKQFTPKRSWQKFCSVTCRNDRYWTTHKIVEVKPNEQSK